MITHHKYKLRRWARAQVPQLGCRLSKLTYALVLLPLDLDLLLLQSVAAQGLSAAQVLAHIDPEPLQTGAEIQHTDPGPFTQCCKPSCELVQVFGPEKRISVVAVTQTDGCESEIIQLVEFAKQVRATISTLHSITNI